MEDCISTMRALVYISDQIADLSNRLAALENVAFWLDNGQIVFATKALEMEMQEFFMQRQAVADDRARSISIEKMNPEVDS